MLAFGNGLGHELRWRGRDELGKSVKRVDLTQGPCCCESLDADLPFVVLMDVA